MAVKQEFVLEMQRLGNDWFRVIVCEKQFRGRRVGDLSGRLLRKPHRMLVVSIKTSAKHQPGIDLALINYCELNARVGGVPIIRVQADERLKCILIANGYRVIRNIGRNLPYKLEKSLKS